MNSQLTHSATHAAYAFLTNNAAKYHVLFGTGLVLASVMYDKKAKQVAMAKTYTNQVSQVPKRGL